MRMDFPSIFLDNFRGPRMLRARSTNFQSLVFISKTDRLLLWHLKWNGKTNRCLGSLRMEDQGEQSPQTILMNNFPSFNRGENKTIGVLSSDF